MCNSASVASRDAYWHRTPAMAATIPGRDRLEKGVDVTKASTRWLTSCTAQHRNGNFCDAPPMEGMPFPICFKHAMKVWKNFDGQIAARLGVDDSGLHQMRESSRSEEARRRELAARQSVVYYVRIGEYIKIGYSTNLTERLHALRIGRDDVLATEPGGRELEQQRHQQFASERLRSKFENFKPSQCLLDHIEAVRDEHGPPSVTARVMLRDDGTAVTRDQDGQIVPYVA